MWPGWAMLGTQGQGVAILDGVGKLPEQALKVFLKRLLAT